MSFHGRLHDSMHEALIIMPGGGDTWGSDGHGPLADIDRDKANEAVDIAVKVAELFISEAVRRALREQP